MEVVGNIIRLAIPTVSLIVGGKFACGAQVQAFTVST
jgi:hypothetical protein